MKNAICYTLLLLLLTVAGYGIFLSSPLSEEKNIEIYGLVQKKFQTKVIRNTFSHYEFENQYWITLQNGQHIQLPANFYKKVSEGEEVSLLGSKGSPLFLPYEK
nr:hypothetical protein [Neobacillus sp. Marseille-Q6967]